MDFPAQGKKTMHPSSAFLSIEVLSGLHDAHHTGKGDFFPLIQRLISSADIHTDTSRNVFPNI